MGQVLIPAVCTQCGWTKPNAIAIERGFLGSATLEPQLVPHPGCSTPASTPAISVELGRLLIDMEGASAVDRANLAQALETVQPTTEPAAAADAVEAAGSRWKMVSGFLRRQSPRDVFNLATALLNFVRAVHG